jgi:hypothetical protein
VREELEEGDAPGAAGAVPGAVCERAIEAVVEGDLATRRGVDSEESGKRLGDRADLEDRVLVDARPRRVPESPTA